MRFLHFVDIILILDGKKQEDKLEAVDVSHVSKNPATDGGNEVRRKLGETGTLFFV